MSDADVLRTIREKAERVGWLRFEIERLVKLTEERRDEYSHLQDELADLVLAAEKTVTKEGKP